MKNIFPILVLLSALSLTVGGISLRLGGLVPVTLTFLTVSAIVILLIYAAYLFKTGSSKYTSIGVIFGIIAFIVSTNSYHIRGLSEFFTTHLIYLAVSDITMILGFYLFPAIYIVIWVFTKYHSQDNTHDIITDSN